MTRLAPVATTIALMLLLGVVCGGGAQYLARLLGAPLEVRLVCGALGVALGVWKGYRHTHPAVDESRAAVWRRG